MGKSASVTLGKGSLNHNNRVFIYKNVDPTLTPQNVILTQKDLRSTYNEIFGEALKNYNSKQNRNDRKILDYLAHIEKSKNGEKPFYEIIVQVGDRYDTGIGSPDAEIAKNILAEFYHEFIQRNPNMMVFNAIIHMDEKDGTPHLHIDFVPIARNQKRGLETKNSFTQALKQQGFDFVPTPDPPQNPNIQPCYGKPVSRFAGGRWLDSERAELGKLLERHDITWEKQNVHRKHLSIPEYKACAEIVGKLVRETPSAALETRIPNTAMRLAGVKSDEVLVSQASLLSLQKENQILQAESQVMRNTMHHMEQEKISGDAYVRRALKAAEVREQRTKDQYSKGTADEYRKLVKEYNSVVDKHNTLVHAYKDVTSKNKELEASFHTRVSQAVKNAVEPLTAENTKLKTELNTLRQTAVDLHEKIRMLCQVIHDIMRAIFMLKYRFKGQQPNPYKSTLTDKANYLIDALERKAHAAIHHAGCFEYENGLDGMGITKELFDDIQTHSPKEKTRKQEIDH